MATSILGPNGQNHLQKMAQLFFVRCILWLAGLSDVNDTNAFPIDSTYGTSMPTA